MVYPLLRIIAIGLTKAQRTSVRIPNHLRDLPQSNLMVFHLHHALHNFLFRCLQLGFKFPMFSHLIFYFILVLAFSLSQFLIFTPFLILLQFLPIAPCFPITHSAIIILLVIQFLMGDGLGKLFFPTFQFRDDGIDFIIFPQLNRS